MEPGAAGIPPIRWADIAIIFATLLGPVLAVQVQKFLEHRREVLSRRIWIFRTLMATRAAKLSPAHVEAINAIPIEFYGGSRKYNSIREAWRQYMGHLNDTQMDQNIWLTRGQDLFINLLKEISIALKYQFDKEELSKEIYLPKAHNIIENEQEFIRRNVVKLLSGEQPIAIDLRSINADPQAIREWTEIRQLAIHYLRTAKRDDSGNTQ